MMKYFAIISLATTLALTSVGAQTAHYVSLIPIPGLYHYTSVQDAVIASSAGDTVYCASGAVWRAPASISLTI